MQYRANILLGLVGSAVTYSVITLLWSSIYSGQKLIGGFTQSEMITYVLVAGLISNYIMDTGIRYMVDVWIRFGKMSPWLVKPINIPNLWFISDAASRLFIFILSAFPFLIVIYFFRENLVGPVSWQNFLLFLLFVFLAGVINYLIIYIVGLLAFWIDRSRQIVSIVRIFTTIAGGSLIPLSLFPGIAGKIINALPFKYLFYVPIQIYLGKISQDQILMSLVGLVIWILIFYLIVKIIWTKGIKKFSAMGG